MARIDMQYEAHWGDLEKNKKFQKHLKTECLSEFPTGLNKELDEVHGRILGQKPLPLIGEAFVEIRHGVSKWKVVLGEKGTNQPHLLAINKQKTLNLLLKILPTNPLF